MMILLTNDLKALPSDKRSWQGVMGRFAQNPFAETLDDYGRATADEFTWGRVGKLRADAAAIAEVRLHRSLVDAGLTCAYSLTRGIQSWWGARSEMPH